MALTKINSSVIANNTIAVGNIADNSVDATKIASNSILTRHIDDAQITTDQILDGTIATADIADDAITSAKLDTNIDIAGTFDVTGATTLDSTLQVDGAITSSSEMTLTRSDNGINLSLVSTDADANEAPLMVLYRNSSSPANNDALGQIYLQGENDADQKVTYSLIEAFIDDASDSSEDGILRFSSMVSGTSRNRMDIIPAATVFNEDSQNIDFRIESNGNANTFFVNGGKDYVSIGTASDFAAGAAILHLHQPDATSNGYLHLTHQDTGTTASDGMSIGLLDNGEDAVIRLRENGDLKFWTNNTNHMTLQSDGKLAVTEISHINGSSGNLEIGNGDEKHIMHSGGYHQFQVADTEICRINAEGIAFNGDTAAANSLDDYEEGTWSASLRGTSGSAGSHAQSSVSAHYRKVGGLCFINAHFYLTNKGSYGGTTTLVGLPFTNTGSTAQISLGSFPDSGYGTTSGNVLIAASILAGGAEVRFYEGARLDGTHAYSDVGTGYYVNIGGCYPVD